MVTLTKRQKAILLVIACGYFGCAVCVALQAPFYPQEAEERGATATEYGLVFGIFEFAVLVVSPFFGSQINKIGLRTFFNGGIVVNGATCIAFGLLDKVMGRVAFIGLSLIIRIVEAVGNTAFRIAAFSLIAKEFSDTISTVFASLEIFFGMGLIVGPMLGGFLYEMGGFLLPFAVLGSALVLCGVLGYFVLPQPLTDEAGESATAPSFFAILKVPGVCLAALSIASTAASIGFLLTTLEPHLRQFHLPPVHLGFMFIINGLVYALTAPIFGLVVDKFNVITRHLTLVGCISIALGFTLIGPAPFIHYPTQLWMVILGLALQGLGISCQLVSSFNGAMRSAIDGGFPDSLETYGRVSGMWTCSFAFGAFAGPTVAGILYDRFSFRPATLFIIALHTLLAVVIVLLLLFRIK